MHLMFVRSLSDLIKNLFKKKLKILYNYQINCTCHSFVAFQLKVYKKLELTLHNFPFLNYFEEIVDNAVQYSHLIVENCSFINRKKKFKFILSRQKQKKMY